MTSRSWSSLRRAEPIFHVCRPRIRLQRVIGAVASVKERTMVFSRFLKALLGAAALTSMAGAAAAQPQTSASHAILVDYDSGEVLFCKNCDQPMPPSSMSKLMTVELLFQRLKDGRLKPEDTFHVSEGAWRQGQKT